MNIAVEPSGAVFEARAGETVMASALAAGFRWPSVCGGLGECGACIAEVLEGGSLLVSPGGAECARLDLTPQRRSRPEAEWRLACQARGGQPGELRLRKTGVRPHREGETV